MFSGKRQIIRKEKNIALLKSELLAEWKNDKSKYLF